jgi:hypothetical protein
MQQQRQEWRQKQWQRTSAAAMHVMCTAAAAAVAVAAAAGEAGWLQPADDELNFWDADDLDMLQLVLHGQAM